MVDQVDNAIIEAIALVPEGELEPIEIRLGTHDTLCLLGSDSERLHHYQRALAGIEPPQSGELRLFGRPLQNLDKKSWREQRQHIGYVARNAPLLSVLRGLDNVILPALYHKRMSRKEAQEKAFSLITELDYDGELHHLPAYLSPLERLQLAIARAIILDPAVLFVEEPFTALSLVEQQPIIGYFLKAREKQAQVISTHSLHLVKACATQILFIGAEESYFFNSWHSLISDSHPEVVHYLELYRQQNQLN